MEAPVLLSQSCERNPDEVAIMFSFVPSFQEAKQGLTPLETA